MHLFCLMTRVLLCGVAAARGEAPRVAPEIELIGTVSPAATAGQWRLLEARPVAASEPAVRNGLQIVATLDRTSFAADEIMTLRVELTNVSDKPMSLLGATNDEQWQTAFNERGVERKTKGKDGKAKAVVLKPGETLRVPLRVDPANVRYVWRAPSGDGPPLDSSNRATT